MESISLTDSKLSKLNEIGTVLCMPNDSNSNKFPERWKIITLRLLKNNHFTTKENISLAFRL